jgi:hypothetical protein
MPALARLEIALADVAQRRRRIPLLIAVLEQGGVDLSVEEEVPDATRVVEQLADRDGLIQVKVWQVAGSRRLEPDRAFLD